MDAWPNGEALRLHRSFKQVRFLSHLRLTVTQKCCILYNMSTLQQGRQAEAFAMADFVGRGFDVFAPVFGNAGCDFVVQHPDGSVKRVEVKSTSYIRPSGSYTVQLRSIRHNKTQNNIRKFDSSRCDYLVVVMFDDGYPIGLDILDAKLFEGKSTATVKPSGEVQST